MEYVADNGTVFNDADIDRWSEEIETGFKDANVDIEVCPVGAWEVDLEPAKPHSIRLADSLWNLIKQDAQKHNMSTSDWIRMVSTKALVK